MKIHSLWSRFRLVPVLFHIVPFLLLLVYGCAHTLPPRVSQVAYLPPPGDSLSLEEAKLRSDRLSRIHYDLSFELDGKRQAFSGQTRIEFHLKEAAGAEPNPKSPAVRDPLRIDFKKGIIREMSVNGQLLGGEAYNGFFITVPGEFLLPGANEVSISYAQPYSANGEGLYRFEDPEDHKVYLYTDFEPYGANRLFPCFDQPDLKATYALEVLAPKDWVVVSAEREKSVVERRGRRHWTFPVSRKFSTYVFSLHAGPYQVWTSRSRNIPLRLLTRKSLGKYVDSAEWFRITRQGLEFFQDYFKYPYPYGKYDQVIVPDFNSGAMENVAAVTFNEKFIFRDPPNPIDRENRANTILHEMAHMWFGNLVTMKWWNDLWLNESFATYMAFLALERATEFKSSWTTFFSQTKQWAYWEDQLVTTHPIESIVLSTNQAFTNFDGITYGKGASILKQLDYFLGENNFQKAVQTYIRTHAHGNTELKDFFASMEKTSGRKLERWVDDWAKKAGPNTLRAHWTCSPGPQGQITEFKLVQSFPNDYPFLREHRTRVAFFQQGPPEGRGPLRTTEILDVTYSLAETPVPQALGKRCPDLVYPNYGDFDYAKVILDDKTMAHLIPGIHLVQDPLARMMFWQALWDRVQDAVTPLQDYVALAQERMAQEPDFRLQSKVVRTLSEMVIPYLPDEGEAWKNLTWPLVVQLEEFLWNNLQKAPPHPELKKLWFDAYLKVAQSRKAQALLRELLSGKKRLPGMTIDQDRRWDILVNLGRYGTPGSMELVKKELKKDPSDLGVKKAIMAEAIRPDEDIKKKWWGVFHQDYETFPLSKLKVAMGVLFPPGQKEFHRPYAEEFFSQLPILIERKDPLFLSAYVGHLTPAFCDQGSVEQLGNYIYVHQTLHPAVMKKLRVAQQEDDRCLRIRQRALMRDLEIRGLPMSAQNGD